MGDWPFANPPEVAVVTTRRIVHEGEPVRLVSRDPEDGTWLFLAGDAFDPADALLVSLRTLVDRDASLAELADLPPGWQASRPGSDAPWERGPEELEDDPDS